MVKERGEKAVFLLLLLSSPGFLLLRREAKDELATGSTFVTEHISVSLLDGFHGVLPVDEGSQEAHLHAGHNGRGDFTPLFLLLASHQKLQSELYEREFSVL